MPERTAGEPGSIRADWSRAHREVWTLHELTSCAKVRRWAERGANQTRALAESVPAHGAGRKGQTGLGAQTQPKSLARVSASR